MDIRSGTDWDDSRLAIGLVAETSAECGMNLAQLCESIGNSRLVRIMVDRSTLGSLANEALRLMKYFTSGILANPGTVPTSVIGATQETIRDIQVLLEYRNAAVHSWWAPAFALGPGRLLGYDPMGVSGGRRRSSLQTFEAIGDAFDQGSTLLNGASFFMAEAWKASEHKSIFDTEHMIVRGPNEQEFLQLHSEFCALMQRIKDGDIDGWLWEQERYQVTT